MTATREVTRNVHGSLTRNGGRNCEPRTLCMNRHARRQSVRAKWDWRGSRRRGERSTVTAAPDARLSVYTANRGPYCVVCGRCPIVVYGRRCVCPCKHWSYNNHRNDGFVTKYYTNGIGCNRWHTNMVCTAFVNANEK